MNGLIPRGAQVWLESVGGIVTAVYTYGNALVRKDSEYPLFDGLGSERTVTNGSQTITGTAIYEGFGNVVATTGSSSNPYMFAATSGYRNDGDAGLLRSVVVAADRRGEGLGSDIVAAAEELARAEGIGVLYLLTETAVDWFPRLGYEVVDRGDAAAAVGASIEVTPVCPDPGAAMRRRLV